MASRERAANQPWVVLALGSNLGPRAAHLARARAALERAGLVPLVASALRETDPVGGPPGQGRYLNQVVASPVAVAPAPHALLALCRGIERSCGRTRRERWGPRTLDIDILFHGREVVNDAALVIPHPELARRTFVLEPLCEILPGLCHPVLGLTARELLARLRSDGSAGWNSTIPPGPRAATRPPGRERLR